MSDLDFQPNRHARALGGMTSKTVGLLFFKDLWDLVVNPFWGMATSTVYQHLLRRDLDCNLISLGEAVASNERFQTAAQFEQFFRTRNVDGFLLVGPVSEQHEEFFARSEIPSVMWGRPSMEGSALVYCDSDNAAGAALAVDHLVERGRRTIGSIVGDLELASARDRYDGFVSAMARHGRPVSDSLLARGDFSRQSGVEAMNALLDHNPDLDGVFAANDEMAVGALQALSARGKSVPSDVSLVGFDNATLLDWQNPRLTSISPSYDKIGEELVTGLLNLMNGQAHSSRLIETSLVNGQTT